MIKRIRKHFAPCSDLEIVVGIIYLIPWVAFALGFLIVITKGILKWLVS